jgi:hypothetical protein
MVEAPAEIADTMPEAEPIVATAKFPEDQVPPPASESVVEADSHTVPEPEIAAGDGLTVIGVVEIQPVGKV